MNKALTNLNISISCLIVLALTQWSYAKENECIKLDEQIAKLEKELLIKSKLLAHRKMEIEKLPPDSTSKKMKLTAETFVTAAESEANQNWIEIKRKEKNRICSTHRHK